MTRFLTCANSRWSNCPKSASMPWSRAHLGQASRFPTCANSRWSSSSWLSLQIPDPGACGSQFQLAGNWPPTTMKEWKFVEDYFTSVLRTELKGNRFKGFYHPPEQSQHAPAGGQYQPLQGIAAVVGSIQVDDGVVSIRGTWHHQDSAFSSVYPSSSGLLSVDRFGFRKGLVS